MDAVSGATERPCPHRSRVVTHEYEDIYGRSTQNAKLFQSVISPKVAVNQKNPNQFVKHSSYGQSPEMGEAQASLLATHIGSANRAFSRTPQRRSCSPRH